MADWDTTNPDDNDIVSQYPSNERAARTAVVANFGVDHHETDDGDVGKHEVIQIVDNEGDATIDAGQVGIWNDGGVLKTRSGTGSVGQLATLGEVSNAVFPSGTTMVFYQAAAPVGWTRLPPSPENDSMLRVVSAAAGEAAGTQGGSWTISGLTVQGHSLTVGQMPNHNHGGSTGNAGAHSHTTGSAGNHGHSGSTSSGGAHTHDVPGRQFNNTTGSHISMQNAGSFANSETTTSAGAHSHSLSINSNGAHTHSISSVSSHDHAIGGQGGGNSHSHGISHNGNWRPKYLNVLVASKD